MPIAGYATPGGTTAYFTDRVGSSEWARPFGATGLACGRVGFGAYRVGERSEEHAQALELALLSGRVNLIDTASNYTMGESECVVGKVLRAAVGHGGLDREAVILVSKAGYVAGPLLGHVGRMGWGDRLMSISSDHGHSLDPEVIDSALSMSLQRLGVDALDVLLVHNPEYHLMGIPEAEREAAEEAFYRHMSRLFVAMEGFVKAGRIGCYGVSSNTMGLSRSIDGATELERFIESARQAGGDGHRFAVIQTPLNLLERGILEEQDGRAPLVQRAHEAGLAVMVNRPLNGFHGDRLYRLARKRKSSLGMAFAARRATIKNLEAAALRGRDVRSLASNAKMILNLSQVVPHEMRRSPNWMAFQGMVHEHLWPTLTRELEVMAETAPDPTRFAGWRRRFESALKPYFESAMAQLELRDTGFLEPIFQQARGTLGAGGSALAWSQQALSWAAGQPGVSCALNGMRKPRYVHEVLAMAKADMS